jgi:alkanesulfonate monooxygenase SsuD/methylene tetrahydromethanopterin reductase-like flavin-dependent oxidoreductase (luciferase family)
MKNSTPATAQTATRFGVFLPTGQAQWGTAAGASAHDRPDARRLIAITQQAERLGFDSLWVNDSLLTPRIEPLTMLAAAATVTERVTLGTATLMPVLRRPIHAAQTIASVDQLAGGRLVIAVGAGFPGRFGQPLHSLSEVPWARRFRRLDETVALWRHLWSGDHSSQDNAPDARHAPLSFHGEILHFDEIPPCTAPFQAGGPPSHRPPLRWLAAVSTRSCRLHTRISEHTRYRARC